MKKLLAVISLAACFALCGCGSSYEDTLLLGHEWGEAEGDFYVEMGDNYRVTEGGELFGYLADDVDGSFGETKGLCKFWYKVTVSSDELADDVVAKMFELLAEEKVLQHVDTETQEFVEWNLYDSAAGVTLNKIKDGSLWVIEICCWNDYYGF